MTDLLPPTELWYTRCPVITGSGLAVQNGSMESALSKYGVLVKNLRNSDTPATRESHFTHSLPRSVRQGGNAPALFAAASGADTVLLGTQLIRQYQGILVAPDSDIVSLADLKGRRFALPRRVNDKIDFWRSIALQGLLGALRLAGITRDQVQWVDLPIERTYFHETPAGQSGQYVDAPRLVRQHRRELTALLRGEVDVIFGYSAWGAMVRDQFELREIATLTSSDDPTVMANNEYPATLTVSRDLVENAPEVVDEYVRQVLLAAEWAHRHRTEALSLLARELGTAEYWLHEGVVGDVLDGFELSLDEHHLHALTARKQFLLDEAFLPRDFDLSAWIEPGPLERARAALAAGAADGGAQRQH